MELVEELILD